MPDQLTIRQRLEAIRDRNKPTTKRQAAWSGRSMFDYRHAVAALAILDEAIRGGVSVVYMDAPASDYCKVYDPERGA